MLITEFEKKIQEEINADLSIRINPNAEDIAGVYYQGVYIGVAVPPQEIHEEHSVKYVDRNGYPYRSIPKAVDIIKGKLVKFQDPEVMKIMNEKL